MPLNLFYTMVQKSQKWPKTQIEGGPALNLAPTGKRGSRRPVGLALVLQFSRGRSKR